MSIWLVSVKKDILTKLSRIGMVWFLIKSLIKITIGFIIRINDQRSSLYKYLEHAVSIYIRMAPSDIDSQPDILMHFDTYESMENEDIINSLERGQEIGFNATFISLPSNSMEIMEMQGITIWKEKGMLEISAFFNENGRYSENKKFLSKK